jgi:branched-chain amino acid transport system ATP-binding protein
LRERAADYLDRVGLGIRANVPVGELAHGEQKQLELAIALATGPRLLLLDEPMAGLGAAESAHMLDLLRKLKGEATILLIEHDMDVVFALADRVSVLVNGQCIATGTSDFVRSNEAVRVAYLGEGDL